VLLVGLGRYAYGKQLVEQAAAAAARAASLTTASAQAQGRRRPDPWRTPGFPACG